MYLKMNDMSMESFRKLFREQGDKQVKVRLALEEDRQAGEHGSERKKSWKKEFASLAEQNKIDVERVEAAVACRVPEGRSADSEGCGADQVHRQEDRQEERPRRRKSTEEKEEDEASKSCRAFLPVLQKGVLPIMSLVPMVVEQTNKGRAFVRHLFPAAQ